MGNMNMNGWKNTQGPSVLRSPETDNPRHRTEGLRLYAAALKTAKAELFANYPGSRMSAPVDTHNYANCTILTVSSLARSTFNGCE